MIKAFRIDTPRTDSVVHIYRYTSVHLLVAQTLLTAIVIALYPVSALHS